MNRLQKTDKIVWQTLESSDGERVLKQHAFKSYPRKDYHWSDEYEGNKALCSLIGMYNGEKFLNVNEVESEKVSPNACKTCLKLSDKPIEI